MATTTIRSGRNELCPCGSGKKYKRCCGSTDVEVEDATSRFFNVAIVLAGIMLIGGTVVFARALLFEKTPQKVWSAEHGHYHTVGGDPHGGGGGGEGKVWSEEHGHYHTAGGGEPAAEGQVWSEEHGHYHKTDGSEVGAATGGGKPALEPATSGRGALESLRAAELDKAGAKALPPAAPEAAPAAEAPDQPAN